MSFILVKTKRFKEVLWELITEWATKGQEKGKWRDTGSFLAPSL